MPRPSAALKKIPDASVFQRAILSWYKRNRRDLPWRKPENTNDPYKVLVSETMLQQTQVDRVIPYYNLFLKKFPTMQALAKAKPGKVITLWNGLGYNRRAVLLQRACLAIVKKGGFPQTFDELVEIPGIGPYTAAAILSFAFNKDYAAPDTNIRRIHSRYLFKGKGTRETIDRKIKETLPHGKAREWNNALMDFGSLVCTSASPRCASCPLQASCTAFRAGTQNSHFRLNAPQEKFEGSTRQCRGMVLRHLKAASGHQLSITNLQKLLKKSSSSTDAIIGSLVKDSLVIKDEMNVRLP